MVSHLREVADVGLLQGIDFIVREPTNAVAATEDEGKDSTSAVARQQRGR